MDIAAALTLGDSMVMAEACGGSRTRELLWASFIAHLLKKWPLATRRDLADVSDWRSTFYYRVALVQV